MKRLAFTFLLLLAACGTPANALGENHGGGADDFRGVFAMTVIQSFAGNGSAALQNQLGIYELPAAGYLISFDSDALVLSAAVAHVVSISGTILGGPTASGIWMQGQISASTISISALGSVKGYFGIYIQATSTTQINNNGVISGAIALDRIAGAGTLTVNNTGMMASANEYGVGPLSTIEINGDTSFTLLNSGTIKGTTGANTLVSNNNAVDNITNSGTIFGPINVGDNADNVINSGVITGVISLGAGVDVYDGRGSRGVHRIDGGAGNDIFTVNTGDIVIETTLGETDFVNVTGSYVLAAAARVENLSASAPTSTAALNLTGNAFAQSIDGNNGNNVIYPGVDSVEDSLNGFLGNDTYVLGNATNDTIGDTGGIDTITSTRSRTLLNPTLFFGDIENLTLLGTGNITGVGNALANVIKGNSGNNRLDGGVETVARIDTLAGGAGDDTYIVRSAGEKIVEAGVGSTDVVQATVSYVLTAGANIDTLQTTSGSGTSAIHLTGNAFDQTIIGNKGANTLKGMAGADILDGGVDTVKDILVGGIGDDEYIIRSSNDDVQEVAGQGNDTVKTFVSFALEATDDVEYLRTGDVFSLAALHLTGNNLAQTIVGNRGNNVINGLGGDDVIQGDWGRDTLTGGLGADRFSFSAAHSGQSTTTMDVITDFTKGASGVGDIVGYFVDFSLGGSTATATSTRAKISANGVATFAANSGTTLADALSDIATSFATGGEAFGEFALFQVNKTGTYHLFISDGDAGVTTGDVLVQLQGITSIGTISIADGGLTILT